MTTPHKRPAIQNNKTQKTLRLLYVLHFLEHNAMYFLVRQHGNLDDDNDDDDDDDDDVDKLF